MSRRKVQLKELQSLMGQLNFACLVIVPGRAFTRRVIDLTKGITCSYYYIKLTKEALADLRAWPEFISHFSGKCLLLNDRWVASDKICFYTDAASSIGYAAVFGTRWFAGKWPVSWKNFHITLMELYPMVAAVETWGQSSCC